MTHDMYETLADALAYEQPPPLEKFDRYRWVGTYTVKCGLRSAMRARERHGGRVDQATVILLVDGTEVLTPWKTLLPHTSPPGVTGQPGGNDEQANPQEAPTGEHNHG